MRKVCLMDQTVDSMIMTVWHADYHDRMEDWKPFQTILHLIDVRAEYSDFERTTTLTLTSKTIIIENPSNSTRNLELQAYIQLLSEDQIEALKSAQSNATIDLDAITEVFTVKRILDQIERRDGNGGTNDIAAIVYAVITKFDIDSALIKSCVHCKRFLTRNSDQCEHEACKNAMMTVDGPKFIERIYMAVSIADHSGTLNCRMMDEYATQFFGYSAAELKALPEQEIDALFQRYILQRFAVKVIVKRKSTNEYFASVLSIENVRSADMAAALKP